MPCSRLSATNESSHVSLSVTSVSIMWLFLQVISAAARTGHPTQPIAVTSSQVLDLPIAIPRYGSLSPYHQQRVFPKTLKEALKDQERTTSFKPTKRQQVLPCYDSLTKKKEAPEVPAARKRPMSQVPVPSQESTRLPLCQMKVQSLGRMPMPVSVSPPSFTPFSLFLLNNSSNKKKRSRSPTHTRSLT